ncbi:YeiH family putative sulfate export transporter [Jeongeupia wiesaeckerbachi]|uniref:YeiH family protein n=1 Tax=Jeongeupia wiesaeckerbachi TaxID=3051218 RepID=UPI003D800393
MTTASRTTPLSSLLPGLLLTLLLAGLALWSSDFALMQQWGLSALTLAIVFGMLLGNTVFPRLGPSCGAGVGFAKARLLRLGIILYGFRLTFQQIGDVGVGAILIDALVLTTTLVLAYQLGTRWLKLDRTTALLIGSGSAICGAAAVLAAEPVVKAAPSKVTIAVSTVVVFGTIAMFVYPLLYPLAQQLGLVTSPQAFGVYTGSTIHEVAQVVAAGNQISPAVADTAVITKMIRVMMLAPFLLFVSVWFDRGAQAQHGHKPRITIPWFALLFIVMAGVNSTGLVPHALVERLVQLDTVLLAMAMAALGLDTRATAIRQAGLKPLLLATVLFGYLVFGGAAINLGIRALIAGSGL